ncbi:MAG TPA: hypothetical protein VGV38_18995 [Pyrinomonadaceae bacterium]|nr:hypothetical protein [Pyrinomonadaceae bacterium]
MRVGVTGHQRLREPAGWDWVRRELDRLLSSLAPPLVGITSLAVGADQLFADAVLRRGGSLEVVIPFAGYELTFTEGHDREAYARLLRHALKREVMERRGSDEEAYLASGKLVADRSELLIAVWDGLPAGGLGGTGDVVRYAVQRGKTTVHLNPVTQEVAEL